MILAIDAIDGIDPTAGFSWIRSLQCQLRVPQNKAKLTPAFHTARPTDGGLTLA
jgi:hypothetical protein